MSWDSDEPVTAPAADDAGTEAKQPESHQPSKRESRDKFANDLWNAFANDPGTRAFKIVGDELHEIPKEEVIVGPIAEGPCSAPTEKPARLKFIELKVPPRSDWAAGDGARHLFIWDPETDPAGKRLPRISRLLGIRPPPPTDPRNEAGADDPFFWQGRLRNEEEMSGIVYEVLRKAMLESAFCWHDLFWEGTEGMFPCEVARLIIQEGPFAFDELVRWDDERLTSYFWMMAHTYVHFSPRLAHEARGRLRVEVLEAIEHGTWTAVE
jgi:hypothetical protein